MTQHPPRSSISQSSWRRLGLIVAALLAITVYTINFFYIHIHVVNLHNLDSNVKELMDSSLPPPPLRSRVPAAEDSESRAHATLTVDTEALTEARVVKKKKKRWAIMMIGSPRTYTFTRSSFIKHVLNQIEHSMDVFTSTQSMANTSCSIEKHSLELLQKDSTLVRFHQSIVTVKKGMLGERRRQKKEDILKTKDRFVNEQNALLQLMEDYSKEHGITYDYIFYTRPDLYYTVPFNIQEIERAIDGKLSTIFSPGCCDFKGFCDRLGAGSYQDYSKMILSSKDWARSGDGSKYAYEEAFRHRAEYVNLTKFDLTLKEDYGFLTLRFKRVAQSCKGETIGKEQWTDTLCNKRTIPDLETAPASCRLLNISNSCSK
eukprot:scaffold7970_cov147-Skeletonema_marinoi.AAC.1